MLRMDVCCAARRSLRPQHRWLMQGPSLGGCRRPRCRPKSGAGSASPSAQRSAAGASVRAAC